MSPASQAWAHKMQGSEKAKADAQGSKDDIVAATDNAEEPVGMKNATVAIKLQSPSGGSASGRLVTPATGHSKSARKDFHKKGSSCVTLYIEYQRDDRNLRNYL